MDETEERKIKRAAANVNERRRMQNINCGFEALRAILNVENSSKLSKSAILRHAVEMLRNLMSENQQLRDQNQFMRNLYCNNNYNSQTMPPLLQTPTSTRNHKKSESSEESPRKRLRLDKTDITENTDQNQTTPTVRFKLPETSESPAKSPKSPRKYSANINKLLASPKRITRSSVIQQNLAYTSPTQPISPHKLQQTPISSILESPSRRSLRLMEKDQQQLYPSPSQPLETPPAIRFTDSNAFSHQPFFYPSSSAKSKLDFEDYRNLILTPESMKMMPPRSAKRSLDAIIHAIDQIEKS